MHYERNYCSPVQKVSKKKKKKSSQFTLKQLEAFEITVKGSCLDMPLSPFLALHNEGRHCDKTSLFAHHSPDNLITNTWTVAPRRCFFFPPWCGVSITRGKMFPNGWFYSLLITKYLVRTAWGQERGIVSGDFPLYSIKMCPQMAQVGCNEVPGFKLTVALAAFSCAEFERNLKGTMSRH